LDSVSGCLFNKSNLEKRPAMTETSTAKPLPATLSPPPTTGGDKALSYLPQITALHEKIINASKGSLTYALEAGELLNSARQAIAKKGEWLRWLGTNLPSIPQTTASLYMRVAENKNVINQQRVANAIEEGKLSIRVAAKLIPQTEKAKVVAAARAATKAANKANAAAVQLEDLLRDLAVDEVYTALKNAHPVGYLLDLAQIILKRNEKRDTIPRGSSASTYPRRTTSVNSKGFRQGRPRSTWSLAMLNKRKSVSSTRSDRTGGSSPDWRDQDGNFEKSFRSACPPRCRLTALHKQRSA
jgi:hypothetical protein